jgi:dihydrofolate reductase
VWHFGGGSLFRSLTELRLVDTVPVAVFPFLLREGVPLMRGPTNRVTLKLTGHNLYAKTGIMTLECAVRYEPVPKRRG